MSIQEVADTLNRRILAGCDNQQELTVRAITHLLPITCDLNVVSISFPDQNGVVRIITKETPIKDVSSRLT